ncbi:MAG: hypothetical protein AVDCRST_MAG85-2582, partial [uncultured Solirubrobacteraceae bacterium]
DDGHEDGEDGDQRGEACADHRPVEAGIVARLMRRRDDALGDGV